MSSTNSCPQGPQLPDDAVSAPRQQQVKKDPVDAAVPKVLDVEKKTWHFAIAGIMRNEARGLQRLLSQDCMQHFIQSGGTVALVDTGSTDTTVEVAERYGAKVLKVGERFLHALSRKEAREINDAYGTAGMPDIAQTGVKVFEFGPARTCADQWAREQSGGIQIVLQLDGSDVLLEFKPDVINEKVHKYQTASWPPPLVSSNVATVRSATRQRLAKKIELAADPGSDPEKTPPWTFVRFAYIQDYVSEDEHGNIGTTGNFLTIDRFAHVGLYHWEGRCHEAVMKRPDVQIKCGNARIDKYDIHEHHEMLARDVLLVQHRKKFSSHRSMYVLGLALDALTPGQHEQSRSHYYLARELMYMHRYERARKMFAVMSEIKQAQYIVQRSQAYCLYAQCTERVDPDDVETFIESLFKAYRVYKQRREPWLIMADFHAKRGEWEDCYVAAHASLAIPLPQKDLHDEAHDNYTTRPLKLCYRACHYMGQFQTGRRYFQQALKLDPALAKDAILFDEFRGAIAAAAARKKRIADLAPVAKDADDDDDVDKKDDHVLADGEIQVVPEAQPDVIDLDQVMKRERPSVIAAMNAAAATGKRRVGTGGAGAKKMVRRTDVKISSNTLYGHKPRPPPPPTSALSGFSESIVVVPTAATASASTSTSPPPPLLSLFSS